MQADDTIPPAAITGSAMADGAEAADEWCLRDGRGNSVTVSPQRFLDNVASLRRELRPGTEIWQVVKGDGYGLGLDHALRLGLLAGVDGFCVGTGAEARSARHLAPDAQILLFTASPPDELARAASLGVTLTVNSLPSYRALAAQPTPVSFLLELDCGFGRYGATPEELEQIRNEYEDASHLTCVGAYTHFGMAADELLAPGTKRFDTMVAQFRDGLSGSRREEPFLTMVASTDAALTAPDLPYSAVDPGRLLYGLAGHDQPGWRLRPVVRRLVSKLAQVRRLDSAQPVRIGYDGPLELGEDSTIGVFPLGWHDGLSTGKPLGQVVVRGVACPVLARTLLHSIVDLSGVPGARVGDEVVIFDNDTEHTLVAAAAGQGQTALWMHMRTIGSIITAASRPAPG